MIVVEFILGRITVSNRFFSSKLELFDEVFMGYLSETSTFFSVKVNIVDIESSVVEFEVRGSGDE